MEHTDLHIAADNHEVALSGRSMFDSVADFLNKGVPLTGLSIYNSFVNTAVDVGNFFGGDFERNNPIEQLQNYDDDLLSYYKEHDEGIEAAGLVVGSFIPGLAAIKALQLASRGKQGLNTAMATGLLSGKKQAVIRDAISEINAGEASLFGNINASKLKAIAYGFGDQALQAAAWETATIATMKANPLLDKDGFEDIMSHMFWGTLVGGGVGGVIEGIAIRSTINNALRDIDAKEKVFDLAKSLGLGNFNAGDRVVALINSIDEMPIPATASEKVKAIRTKSHAEIEAWKTLKTISPEADENLGKAFIDSLYHMRHEAQLTKEEMYDYLARLARISRADSESYLKGDDVFYVNRFAKKEDVDFGDLIIQPSKARTAEEAAHFLEMQKKAASSYAYTMVPGATNIRVSRFDDVITSADKQSVQKYTSKTEAFEAGEDFFIDSQLNVSVNQNSVNVKRVPRPGEGRILSAAEEKTFRSTGNLPAGAKPLYGAPLFFNVLTGHVTDRAYAVIGDIAPIKSIKDLLTYDSRGNITGISLSTEAGKKYSSTHYVESGFNYHDDSALDANARYVWAFARGLKKDDIINYNDIPMLEQVIRTGNADGMDKVRELNVRMRQPNGDISKLPDAAAVLERQVWKEKDAVIAELLGDGSKRVDATEVAIKANVPKQYLEAGMRANKWEEVSVPIQNSLKVNTIRLEYDIGDLSVQEGNILRGMVDMQYRVDMAKQQALNAVTNYYKAEAPRMVARGTAKESSILGAGPGAFTASSADYGTLAQQMESLGNALSQWMQVKRSYVTDHLAGAISAFEGDEIASAELAVITNIGRRVSRQFQFLPENIAVQYTKQGATTNTMVLEKSLIKDPGGAIIGWKPDYVPNEGVWINGSRFGKLDYSDKPFEGAFTYYNLNPKVANFLRAGTELNDERLVHHNTWLAAQGIARKYDLGTVYFPPIDTARYKYVALVREAEGIAFGTSDAGALVSDSAEGLQKKVALVLQDNPQARISFKGTSKDYHEALGDYDYSLNLVESAVDSNLRKKGILSDVLPNVRGQQQLKEYFDWHIRQEERQSRNFMELGNAQLFAELRALGKKFMEPQEAVGPQEGRFFRRAENPFRRYTDLALNISPKQEYRLWQDSQEKVEAFAATAFRQAKELLGQASKGLISYEQATELTTKFGLGNPYQRTIEKLGELSESGATKGALERFAEANRLPLGVPLSRFVQKANSILAATVIRLDVFQTLINVVSTPVLLTAEFASAKNNPALRQLLTTTLPGAGDKVVPAYSKILFESVGDFFGRDKEALVSRYRMLGTVRELSSDYQEMLSNLTIAGSTTVKKLEEMGEKAVKLGVKISRADWAEEFVRFVASRTADKLFSALGHSGQALDDNIRTFVNRVHGNYLAAQRPVAFQGPIGQAVGLFQTYQFNLMQQTFRYVANQEKLPLAMLYGIQGTLFGMQGIPGFHALNTHIVGNASNNPEHKDFYSQVPALFDKKLGDWMLYGSLSSVLSTGLYSRGDINPRQISILPVNPLNFPAISAGIRFVGNLWDLGTRMKDGARFSDALLQGLEHNALSRPLTGIAQMVQGYTTTSKGSLISASNDWDSIATASRILGARPLDEAVALDALYRKTAYQAKDTARIQQLGEAVKTTLIAQQTPTVEELQSFAGRYAASGGRVEHFGRKMIEWTRDANQSTANDIYRSLRSPLNQNMMRVMGGERLPDFSTSLPASVTATSPIQ
jgi:hypothetical protein